MWTRIVEVMLGCWLAVSPFVFDFPTDRPLLWINALGGAAAVIALALASLSRRRERLHLGILLVCGWLAAHTFFGVDTVPPPPAYQNQLVLALLLAMIAVLPTRTHEPPAGWIEFHARRGERVEPYGLPDAED